MIRGIQSEDWPDIDDIQRLCFPASAIESLPALRSIARAAPRMCMVAEAPGTIAGYLLAHPWSANDLPPLNEPLPTLPAGASCLFIHDLAIRPSARGTGLAGRMVRRLLTIARNSGMTGASLISVQETSEFWARFGFVKQPEQTARFRGYVRRFFETEFQFMAVSFGDPPGSSSTPPPFEAAAATAPAPPLPPA